MKICASVFYHYLQGRMGAQLCVNLRMELLDSRQKLWDEHLPLL